MTVQLVSKFKPLLTDKRPLLLALRIRVSHTFQYRLMESEQAEANHKLCKIPVGSFQSFAQLHNVPLLWL